MGPFVFVWIVCGVLGAMIGSNKRMGGVLGFVLGVLLGPLGVIVVAISGSPTVLDRVQATGGKDAEWLPDPLGRFDTRWWDGQEWTQHVGRVEPDGSRRTFEDPT